MKMSAVVAVCALSALSALSVVRVQAQDKEGMKSAAGDMELSELITKVARRLGKQFVIDPRVRSQVTLAGVDPGQISYDQLLAILDVHQVAVTESGGILAVVPDANARQFPSPVYTDVGFNARDNEIVTLLITPKNVCAPWLVPVLRPLESQAAHLAAEMQTNTLIVNDRALNVRRIANLVDQLDKRGKGVKDCPTPASFTSTPAGAASEKPAR